MKHPNILAALCIAMLLAQAGYAQPNLAETIIPPSPDAAAFAKYGSIPVSKYTGVPNISIPLYTLEGSHLNLPISLSYHASGIRVEEKGGWVGLGWTLNAGGVITRTVRGLPDNIYGVNGVYGGTCSDALEPMDATTYYQAWSYFDDLPYQEKKKIVESKAEQLLDVYSLSIPGFSGEFFIDCDGEVHFFSHQNISVEFDAGTYGNSFFTVTTPDGSQYIFEARETTYSDTECLPSGWVSPSPANVDPTTAWYLTRIVAPNGNDVVELYYSDPISIWEDMTITETKGMNTLRTPDCFPYHTSCLYSVTHHTPFLERIYHPASNMSVDFFRSEREDLNGGANWMKYVSVRGWH